MAGEKKKKIKKINPYEFKGKFKESNPQQFDIGKKIKKKLSDILKE